MSENMETIRQWNNWNWEKIEKLWKKLKVPKKYESMRCSTETLANNDYVTLLSVREDSGKTTQALLLSLCAWWSVNEQLHILYQRCDESQIRLSVVQTLFDNIRNFGYIERLTDGKYNNVIYKPMEHCFYMANTYTDEKGRVLHELSNDYFMRVICLENYLDYKSSISDPISLWCVFDEIMDSGRQTQRQMVEMCNNVSTFGRPNTNIDDEGKPLYKMLLLGNNTNKYSFWWSEFCVENDISNLKYGSYIRKVTNQGTSMYIQLLATSKEFKDRVNKKKIHFFGFDTPKMSAFNGLQEWQEEVYPHILYDDMINESECVCDNLFLLHRNKYVQLRVFSHEKYGNYIFANYFNYPKREDAIVITINPQEINEIYGFGEFTPFELKTIKKLILGRKIYFSSNSVGSLFDDYIKEFKKNKLF